MKNRKILIVEDEGMLLETWFLMFKKLGVDILMASNGIEAVEVMENNQIDLIVTDLQMPIADGFHVLEYIKASNKDIITWVSTGELSPCEELDDFKIDKIVLKPFNMLREVREIMEIT